MGRSIFSRLARISKRESEEAEERRIAKKFYGKRRIKSEREYEKKLLKSPRERDYERYAKQQIAIERQERRQERMVKRRERAERISETTGRFFEKVAKQRKRQLVFARDIRRPVIGSGRTEKGKRGRPKGTVKYRHPETGQPIGVYEYRKILSAQLRGQRIRQMRETAISPQQQAYLYQMERRERAKRMSPESQIIPDTDGTVNLKSIHDEIEEYANLAG